MSNIKVIETPEAKRRQSVLDTLEEAKKEGFVWVIVFGLRADRTMMSLGSASDDVLYRLGALEVVKRDLLEQLDKGR